MNLQQTHDQSATAPISCAHCTGADPGTPQSCGRPFPSVRSIYAGRRHRAAGRVALIAISQRDDTVVLRASEARRLARALIRAAGRR